MRASATIREMLEDGLLHITAMSLYQLSKDAITRLDRTDFAALGMYERGDLQRLLRDNISVIAPGSLVISEEFSDWDRSDRRIDLLAVDQLGQLVVVELKRTTDDSLADHQAIRYAALVSQMTFDEAVEALRTYLDQRGRSDDARQTLLNHLGWSDPTEGRFNDNVTIILAALDFNPEVTSTVLWLNSRDLNIVCIRLQPYRLGSDILVDVQQIIPLPEATDYQIQIRQKQREARAATDQSSDWTRYDLELGADRRKSLYKREVIYETARFLLDNGVNPAAIEALATRKVFDVVEGMLDGPAFRAAIQSRRPHDPNILKRVYCADEQIVCVDGKTYGVSTQWSKTSMEPTMDALIKEFGKLGIQYGVSSSLT